METNEREKDPKPNEGKDKEINIIVNGRRKVVTQTVLTFSEIVKLAFDTPPEGDNLVFTVTYRGGEGFKPEGTLVEGESVKIKNGMVFNVTATNKS